jgi:hypothetical protein
MIMHSDPLATHRNHPNPAAQNALKGVNMHSEKSLQPPLQRKPALRACELHRFLRHRKAHISFSRQLQPPPPALDHRLPDPRGEDGCVPLAAEGGDEIWAEAAARGMIWAHLLFGKLKQFSGAL